MQFFSRYPHPTKKNKKQEDSKRREDARRKYVTRTDARPLPTELTSARPTSSATVNRNAVQTGVDACASCHSWRVSFSCSSTYILTLSLLLRFHSFFPKILWHCCCFNWNTYTTWRESSCPSVPFFTDTKRRVNKKNKNKSPLGLERKAIERSAHTVRRLETWK